MIAPRTFSCGDSDRVILPRLAESGLSFDLILTDPPYNLSKDFGNDSDSLTLPDFLAINKHRIEACSRILSPNGSLVWFGIHHFIGYLQVMMYDVGLSYRRMNIWRYLNGFSRSSKAPRGEYEPFLWFSKSNRHWTFNADDLRIPYKSTERLKSPVYYKKANGVRAAWTPNPQGSLHGDIWEYPTLAGKRFARERTGHPTQKPESLMRDLVRAFCPKDADGFYAGRVLDPFGGSGTLGVVCEKLNLEGNRIEWYSIELEPQWIAVSEQRVREIHNTLL